MDRSASGSRFLCTRYGANSTWRAASSRVGIEYPRMPMARIRSPTRRARPSSRRTVPGPSRRLAIFRHPTASPCQVRPRKEFAPRVFSNISTCDRSRTMTRKPFCCMAAAPGIESASFDATAVSRASRRGPSLGSLHRSTISPGRLSRVSSEVETEVDGGGVVGAAPTHPCRARSNNNADRPMKTSRLMNPRFPAGHLGR